MQHGSLITDVVAGKHRADELAEMDFQYIQFGFGYGDAFGEVGGQEEVIVNDRSG